MVEAGILDTLNSIKINDDSIFRYSCIFITNLMESKFMPKLKLIQRILDRPVSPNSAEELELTITISKFTLYDPNLSLEI